MILERKNWRLYVLAKVWKNPKKWFGIYNLNGLTGSGKTTFLQDVFKDNDSVLWLTDEEVEMMYIESVRSASQSPVPPQKVIVVEGIDQLRKKATIMEGVRSMLQDWAEQQEKKLVICTSNNPMMKELEGFQTIYIYPVKITRRIVKKKAKQLGISLNGRDVDKFMKCSNFSELETLLLWLERHGINERDRIARRVERFVWYYRLKKKWLEHKKKKESSNKENP